MCLFSPLLFKPKYVHLWAKHHPRAAETVVKLERIPNDAPSRNRQEWAAIMVPTLVLDNRHDPVPPFASGEVRAQNIPHAEFRELTLKSVDPARHAHETQTFIEAFLLQHFAA